MVLKTTSRKRDCLLLMSSKQNNSISKDVLQKNTTCMIHYVYLLIIFTRVSSLAVSIVSAREVLSDITASSTGNCAVASTCLFKTKENS